MQKTDKSLGLAAVAVGLCWLCCSCGSDSPVLESVEPAAFRNLLLITMDTTRADALSCYGNDQAHTPVLDRLAREGVRFTETGTCSPMTAPSHASILTGLYPFEHHVRVNGSHRLTDGYTTLAEVLKNAGHITHAEVAAGVLDAQYGLGQGFDTYHDVQLTSTPSGLPERRGGDIADSTIRALEPLALSGDTFFLWAHFFDPHHPFEAPDFEGDDPEEAYLAEVSFMDAQIGRIVDTLRETGLSRNTLVVLVGDHGEGFGEHHEVGHGYFVYRTTMRVPLVLWGPSGLPAGREIDTMVRTVDLTPTILQLLKIDEDFDSQGRSLLPLIDGLRDEFDPPSYGESMRGHLRFGLCPLRSVRRGAWKLIWSSRPALFNIETDPDELHNLHDTKPEIAEDLRKVLFSLIEEAGRFQDSESASVSMTPQERSRLQALGYLGGESSSGGSFANNETDLLQVDCADPTEYAEAIDLSSSAVAALALGRFELAEEQFRELLALFGDAPNLLSDLAQAVAGQGRMTEAVALFDRALALAPDDVVIRILFMEELIEAAMWAEALEQATILQKTAPDSIEGSYGKGIALVGLGRLDEAMDQFERGRQSHPEDDRPIRGLVLAMTSKGMLADAESLLREELARGRRSALLLRDLALTLERQGRPEEAIDTLQEATELGPDDPMILEYQAVLLARAGRSEEAMESINRALVLAPADLGAILTKAGIAETMGRGEEVLVDFDHARGLDPDDLTLVSATAKHLVRLERRKDAEKVLREALATHPSSAILLGDLAAVAQIDGRSAEANELYRKALEVDPRLDAVRARFATYLMEQDRLEESAAEWEMLVTRNPEDILSLYYLARVYNRQDRFPEAIEHLEKACLLAPKDVRTRFALATVHWRAQHVDESEALCKEVLGLDPNHEGAARILERISAGRQP